MGKLDELKAIVAEMFTNAKTPEEIKNQVNINNYIGEVEKEIAEKDKAFVAVRDAYQEALKGQGSSVPPKGNNKNKTNEEIFQEALESAKKIK